MAEIKYVSIGSDLWESESKDDYLGVTLHFILDWILKTKTLGLQHMEESKTAVNLKKVLDLMLSSYKIQDKLIGGTSDSGRNIFKAIR